MALSWTMQHADAHLRVRETGASLCAPLCGNSWRQWHVLQVSIIPVFFVMAAHWNLVSLSHCFSESNVWSALQCNIMAYLSLKGMGQ